MLLFVTLRCQTGKFGAREGIAVDNRGVLSKDCGDDFNPRLLRAESMYIHMFAFRFKQGITSEKKEYCVSEIRKLKDEIKEVQEAWVGINTSPRGQGYELGGSMKFADAASFERYNEHPVHQKLLGWLIPLIDPIEVDFSL